VRCRKSSSDLCAGAVLLRNVLVRRIQEQQGRRFNAALYVEAVAVDHLVEAGGSLLGAIGVQLDPAALALRALGDHSQCFPFACAGIERCKVRIAVSEMATNTAGFGIRQREVAETKDGGQTSHADNSWAIFFG